VAAEPEKPAVIEQSPALVAPPVMEQTPTPAPTTSQIVTPATTPVPTSIAKPTAISKPTTIPNPTAISKPTAVPPPQKRKVEAISQPEPTTTAPPTPPSTQSTPPNINTPINETQPAAEQAPEQALLEYARVEAARAAGELVDKTEAQKQPHPQPATQHSRVDAPPPAKRARKAVPTPTAKPNRKSTSAAPSASSSRRGSQSVVPTIEDSAAIPGDSTVSTPDPTTKPKKRKYSKAETSEPDGTEKPKRTRKKREPTPEGAESVEILPNVMKMSELCKDLRTGKKSKREAELRKLDQAEEERKKQGGAAGSGTPVKEPEREKTEQPVDWKPQSGPKMRIVNGEIVLDNTSLQVDRHADAAREAGDLEDVVESSFTRKINQASYGKRSKTETWDEDLTDLFYRGLRMFGTDFMVISKMFPGRSRRQIKLKFNNEERRDPQRIKDTLLGPREAISLAAYSEMTNTVYDDPKTVQEELDEEKKRIEDQHVKEKELQEEILRNPTGGETKEEKNDKANLKKTRKKQVKNTGGGGTEEVLGSIDDFPMA
jgi:transcription factor TFIIIB component B''